MENYQSTGTTSKTNICDENGEPKKVTSRCINHMNCKVKGYAPRHKKFMSFGSAANDGGNIEYYSQSDGGVNASSQLSEDTVRVSVANQKQ